MGFSREVKEEIFVRCARHCCVCRKGVGLNIEVHHIKPQKQGGDDSIDNAIGLCFNCHADAGHYFAGHPKGSKLSPSELKKHRNSWFNIVETNDIKPPPENYIEIVLNNKKSEGSLTPIFVQETTRYIDKKSMYRFYELTGEDPMDFVRKRINENTWNSPFYIPNLNKIKTYDEYLDFMSSDKYRFEDENENIDCQPIKHSMNMMKMTEYKEINKSNCVIDISIKNISSVPLEDYKIYLNFENVVNVDSVDKNDKHLDFYNYSYNVKFDENLRGEFTPSQNVLVQKDTVRIDSICFRTRHDTNKVVLKWELFARNISDKGEIELTISPVLEEDDHRTKYVNPDEVREPTIRVLPKLEFE
ncbi:HNH endonuclease [Marinirhabdus gelatinilytica]|uniref:HNH endonuclease n=1 Tax=Marinirhabdus gelatinilytica TaxID=1703343 RepID=A0A370QF30_9FLAO|nr:HNH endonuclease [Marinirhabdus gelatinilytica]